MPRVRPRLTIFRLMLVVLVSAAWLHVPFGLRSNSSLEGTLFLLIAWLVTGLAWCMDRRWDPDPSGPSDLE